MKLIRFGIKGQERPGIEIEGKRLDCSAHFADWNNAFFVDNGLSKIQALLDAGERFPEVSADARWGSPIARPSMIMCVGLNYSDHAAESGMAVPEDPILFMKATNTLGGPNDEVEIPKDSQKADWEVELGIIIGKDALYLKDESEAQEAIASYCTVNDISEREFQLEKGGQWVKGKTCPGFTAVGPYLVTKDEVKDVLDLKMNLSVNGQMMQDGSTNTMVFDPLQIVLYISQFMRLEAGDLISTGTPPGVGLGIKPPVYLKSGDEVSLSIQDL